VAARSTRNDKVVMTAVEHKTDELITQARKAKARVNAMGIVSSHEVMKQKKIIREHAGRCPQWRRWRVSASMSGPSTCSSGA
jgi:hypothetical protein